MINDGSIIDGGKCIAPARRAGVDHNYHDYSNVAASEVNLLFPPSAGGLRQHNPMASAAQQQGFAVKLQCMLVDADANGETAVGWQPHGRCFVVHDRKAFVERILPNYFLQSNFASFQRQLNLYGFKRLASARDKGGYYHELFLRGKPELACYIQRMKKKGKGPRKPDSPESEPDFYAMPFLPQLAYRMPVGGSAAPRFQNQRMGPFPYDQPYHHKQAGVQVLSLKNLLPVSLGPPPPGVESAGHQPGPPMPPAPVLHYPHPSPLPHSMETRRQATRDAQGSDYRRPTPIAPRQYIGYYDHWDLPPPTYTDTKLEPPRSSPEYQSRLYWGGYGSASHARRRAGEDGRGQKPSDSPTRRKVSGGACRDGDIRCHQNADSNDSSTPTTNAREGMADYHGGIAKAPQTPDQSPVSSQERDMSPISVTKQDPLAPLAADQTSTRSNSWSLSPSCWQQAFGEGEEFWCHLD